MTQVPLAPPPQTGQPIDGWLFLLWKRLTATGQILWDTISFTGSDLTDIETRNHADLQNLNTASYTHLTATQATDLTDGGDSTLHYHASDRALANTTGLGTGVGTALAIAVGTTGAPVILDGAGGTPSSLTGTNISGTAANLTAGQATAALGLKSATTTVGVSAATAPSVGQVLTATSDSLATWQTPAAGSTAYTYAFAAAHG